MITSTLVILNLFGAGFGLALEKIVFDVILAILRAHEMESGTGWRRADLARQPLSVPDEDSRHGTSIGGSQPDLQSSPPIRPRGFTAAINPASDA